MTSGQNECIGAKENWLAVLYGQFEEARGWVILNARAERVILNNIQNHPLQISIIHT